MTTKDSTQIDPRKPFTAVTFANIRNHYVSPRSLTEDGRTLHWDAQVDLGYELASLVPHLSERECIDLVDYACGGLPVMLTWEHPYQPDRNERFRTVVIIDYLSPPRPGNAALRGYVRVRRSGFCNDVSLEHVRAVERIEMEHTFPKIES